MILIFIGGFVKISIFFFAAVTTLRPVIKIDQKILIAAIGILICVNTLSIRGFIQHVWSADFIRIPYIHGLFAIAIPVMLLLNGIAKPTSIRKKKIRKWPGPE